MEENDFVSIWLEETGNPAIEELTKANMELAKYTEKVLSDKKLQVIDFAMIVDINPDEISRWLIGKHSFSIKKLKELADAIEGFPTLA